MSDDTPFSKLLRQRTSANHSESEGSGFMSGLMRGPEAQDDYVALLSQHWFVYTALESTVREMATHTVVSPFVDPRLERVPSLKRDLGHFLGADWESQLVALPATRRYAEAIRATNGWGAGVVAHHYIRYLGDLSGGQHIGRALSANLGLTDRGAEFFRFDIDDLDEFKNNYRNRLDTAPLSAGERERMIGEVVKAYNLNTAVFDDLAAAKAGASA